MSLQPENSAPCALVREISSSAEAIDTLCHEVRTLLRRLSFPGEVFAVEMLLRESLNNAMVHGHQCDPGKIIRLEITIGGKWIVLRVTDEGGGFDHRKYSISVPDPESTRGRGLVIYSLYAHRFSFNSTGNEVCLWRAVTGDERS